MDPRATSLLAPLVFLLPGLALCRGLGEEPRAPIWTRIGLSYLFGVAALCQVTFLACLWTGLPLRRGTFLGIGIGLCAVALAHRPRAGTGCPSPASSARWTPPAWGASALVLLGIVMQATVLVEASEPIQDWDGRMTWIPKARFMAAEDSVLPTPLTDAGIWVIHPRYPPLMPIAQVALTRLVQDLGKDWLVRGLYAAFFPALLLALYGTLRGLAGGTGALIATALVATLPMLAWSSEGGVTSTYSDIPLAVFLGIGALLLSRAAGARQGLAAGLCLGAALLAKNEGVILAPATLLGGGLALLATPRRARSPGAARALWVAAVWVALVGVSLLFWRSQIPNRNDEGYFESFSAAATLARMHERLPAVAATVGEELTTAVSWGWFWPVAAASCLLGWRWVFTRRTIVYWTQILAMIGMAALAYAATVDLDAILKVTAYRFLAQVVVPVAALIAVAIGGLAGELDSRPLPLSPEPSPEARERPGGSSEPGALRDQAD